MATESICVAVVSLFLGGDACEEDFRYHDCAGGNFAKQHSCGVAIGICCILV